MHDTSVVLLVVGVAVVGTAPIAVLVAWLARRTSADGATHPARGAAIAVTVVTLLALGGGWYALASLSSGSASDAGDMEGMPGMTSAGSAAGASRLSPVLPATIAGLPLTSSATGDEALEKVSQLHGTDLPLAAAAIGWYAGPAGRSEVWVAIAAGQADAATMTQKMTDGIARGNSPFEAPRLLPARSGVWMTRGMGQVHYFFARGAAVWWVSIDAGLAEQALRQALAAAG